MVIRFIAWGLFTSGNFFIQSAYATQIETLRHHHNQASLWKLIWKWNGPERIKAFLWIVAHNSLIKNETKARRHFAEDPYCHHCPLVAN